MTAGDPQRSHLKSPGEQPIAVEDRARICAAILDATDDGILVTDEHGVVIDANSRYLQLWQLTRAEVIGLHYEQALALLAPHLADSAAFIAVTSAAVRRDQAESHALLTLTGGNVFEELMDTVKYASLGQISEALFRVGGRYRRAL